MKLKFKTYLDFFILFIIVIKICFVFFAAGNSVLNRSTNDYIHNIIEPKFKNWKNITEIIYIVSMGILLIYIFKIRDGGIRGIEEDVGFLLFLFGVVLILTANWNVLLKNYTWYQKFINAISVK